MAKRKSKYEAHVRLYRHELKTPAYRSLSSDARALLIEFRALFKGVKNEIYLSSREMQKRCGIGQRRAKKACDELLDRGFIRVLEKGGFSRKTRHATVFELTNEPRDPTKMGATPTKDYMTWEPDQKNTVAESATVGSQNSYREGKRKQKKSPHGSQNSYRHTLKPDAHGSQNSYTDKLPGSAVL